MLRALTFAVLQQFFHWVVLFKCVSSCIVIYNENLCSFNQHFLCCLIVILSHNYFYLPHFLCYSKVVSTYVSFMSLLTRISMCHLIFFFTFRQINHVFTTRILSRIMNIVYPFRIKLHMEFLRPCTNLICTAYGTDGEGTSENN